MLELSKFVCLLLNGISALFRLLVPFFLYGANVNVNVAKLSIYVVNMIINMYRFDAITNAMLCILVYLFCFVESYSSRDTMKKV